MVTPAKQRLAECRARGRLCDVDGCGIPAQKWGRYCDHHDRKAERTGDPEGRTIRVSELRPFLKLASRYIREHQDLPSIERALWWLHELVYGSRPTVSHLRPKASPQERLCRWLDQMKARGVTPEEMLAMVTAFYLLQEWHPRAFKSDRHFRHQLANRLLRMVNAPRSEVWQAGERAYRHDRVTVGMRELLATRITSALGVTCLSMARVIVKALTAPDPFPPTSLTEGDVIYEC